VRAGPGSVGGVNHRALRVARPGMTVGDSASEHLHPDGADHDRLLLEALLELGAVALPPGAVEVARHDLEHHDVVAARVAALAPDALGRRAGEARDAAERRGEFGADAPIGGAVEAPARIVGERQQDLDEVPRREPSAAGADGQGPIRGPGGAQAGLAEKRSSSEAGTASAA
jgi:hypothetical protein